MSITFDKENQFAIFGKRLLKRCGDGNRYLNETGTVSVRPSGLRIRRAEA
jgi:hypothetical protein